MITNDVVPLRGEITDESSMDFRTILASPFPVPEGPHVVSARVASDDDQRAVDILAASDDRLR